MWTYQQSTGQLFRDGSLVDTGYAGMGDGVNNPDMEDVEMVGPLPRGYYTIGSLQANGRHMGPNVMFLKPDVGNEMHGRSAFYMHGDNGEGDRSASNGCIIMNRSTRLLVAQSGDNQLEVIA
jgi:hypothetical protein